MGSKTNASKEECTPFVGTIDVVGNLFFICEASTRSEIYRRGNACELQMEMYYLNFLESNLTREFAPVAMRALYRSSRGSAPASIAPDQDSQEI